MSPQKVKQGLPKRRKNPPNRKTVPLRGGRSPPNNVFSGGGDYSAYSCSPPPLAGAHEQMHNIFGNYVSHNYIKIHSTLHSIELIL